MTKKVDAYCSESLEDRVLKWFDEDEPIRLTQVLDFVCIQRAEVRQETIKEVIKEIENSGWATEEQLIKDIRTKFIK